MGQFDIISTVSFLSRCLWQHKMSKTNMFHALVRVSLWSQRGTGAPPSFFCWVPRHILGRCQFGADHLGTTLCSKEISKRNWKVVHPQSIRGHKFLPSCGRESAMQHWPQVRRTSNTRTLLKFSVLVRCLGCCLDSGSSEKLQHPQCFRT